MPCNVDIPPLPVFTVGIEPNIPTVTPHTIGVAVSLPSTTKPILTTMLATDVAQHYVHNQRYVPLRGEGTKLVLGFDSYKNTLTPLVDLTSARPLEERKAVTQVWCSGPRNTYLLLQMWTSNTDVSKNENVFPLVSYNIDTRKSPLLYRPN